MIKSVNRLKSLVSISMLMAIVCFSSVAVRGAESRTEGYTLKKAVDAAVENSPSLKLLDEKIKLAQRRYSTAIKDSKEARYKSWTSDEQHVSNKKEELLYPLQKESEINKLEWERQNSEKKLRNDVAMLYYQILQAKKHLDNQSSAITRAEVEYDAMAKKVRAGLATETLLMSYDIVVNESQALLNTYQRDLDILYINFNEKLGLVPDTIVNLSSATLPDEELSINSIDKLANKVVAASHDVAKLETDKELIKIEHDILYEYSDYIPDDCDTLEDSLLNSDYSIRDQKVAVELKVRSDYNNLLNLKDDTTIRKMEYDQKVKLLEIAQKRYDIGMSTYLDVLKAQGERDTALVGYDKARLDYYSALQSFKLYIDPVVPAEK